MFNVEQIAKICHEANKAYCESIGDVSQTSWHKAPDWQRQSAINGVKFHLEKDRQPEDSHESWMREKEEAGWRYGHVKDANKKEHPAMVPFKDLPQDQKIKDFIFSYIVKAFKDAEPF
jgi:hypothetical protein